MTYSFLSIPKSAKICRPYRATCLSRKPGAERSAAPGCDKKYKIKRCKRGRKSFAKITD